MRRRVHLRALSRVSGASGLADEVEEDEVLDDDGAVDRFDGAEDGAAARARAGLARAGDSSRTHARHGIPAACACVRPGDVQSSQKGGAGGASSSAQCYVTIGSPRGGAAVSSAPHARADGGRALCLDSLRESQQTQAQAQAQTQAQTQWQLQWQRSTADRAPYGGLDGAGAALGSGSDTPGGACGYGAPLDSARSSTAVSHCSDSGAELERIAHGAGCEGDPFGYEHGSCGAPHRRPHAPTRARGVRGVADGRPRSASREGASTPASEVGVELDGEADPLAASDASAGDAPGAPLLNPPGAPSRVDLPAPCGDDDEGGAGETGGAAGTDERDETHVPASSGPRAGAAVSLRGADDSRSALPPPSVDVAPAAPGLAPADGSGPLHDARADMGGEPLAPVTNAPAAAAAPDASTPAFDAPTHRRPIAAPCIPDWGVQPDSTTGGARGAAPTAPTAPASEHAATPPAPNTPREQRAASLRGAHVRQAGVAGHAVDSTPASPSEAGAPAAQVADELRAASGAGGTDCGSARVDGDALGLEPLAHALGMAATLPAPPPAPSDAPRFGHAWTCMHDTPAQHIAPPLHAPRGTPSFTLCARTGMRPYMEDRCMAQHCALDSGRAHLAALYDGHNGSHAAALAVEQMVSVIAERMGSPPPSPPLGDESGVDGRGERAPAAAPDGPRDHAGAEPGRVELGRILYDSFSAMNARVLERSDELAREAEASGRVQQTSVGGTTAIVCVLSGAVAHVAAVGDSRAVLARAGRAVRITVDHKPRLPAEEERIVACGGFVNRGRVHGILSVSRSLGDFEFAPYVLAEPQVLAVPLMADDRCLLLASDGLWDVLTDDEAVEIALRIGTGPAADPTAAGQHLVDEALRRGSRDNVSVVCVFRD